MSYGKILGVAATIFLIVFLDTSSLVRNEYHNLKKIEFQQSENKPAGEPLSSDDLVKRAPTTINNNVHSEEATNATRIQANWSEKFRKKTKQLQQHLEDSFLKLTNMFTNIAARFNKTVSENTNFRPRMNTLQKKTSDVTQCPKSYQEWKTKINPISPQKKDSQEIMIMESLFCRSLNHHQLTKCNVTELIGVLKVHEENVAHEWLHKNELSFVHRGGWWSPKDCLPVQSTLIVIPFRDREDQLPILLRHLHPMLKRQRLHYRILIVEQTGRGKFNRAKLANVGFEEGLKIFPYNCFIIHDVDLVPENDNIDYSCSASPRHLSAAVSTLNYRLPYAKIFGGVSSLLSEHFKQVNGFSNLFYGWGGEDDNMYYRLVRNGLKIQRHSIQIARYKMLKHKHYKPGGIEQVKLNRKLGDSLKHNKEDGLNTLQYDLIGVEEELLYTRVKVDVREDKENFVFK